MSSNSGVKIKEETHQPTKTKSPEDGCETDAETAASTPARSSVLSSSPAPEATVSSAKVDMVLPKEIDTSKTKTAVEKEEVDYSDWPLHDIKEPHENDVLYGRGGGTNHHPGNKRYRKLVEGRKVDYVNSKRLDKPLVALDIIREWRSQKPPGRFLKIDEDTGLWHDVGDKKAREKTSQALREKAPMLRKQQEEQRKEREMAVNAGNQKVKNTRFDIPTRSTPKPDKNLKRGMLTRDHSLGVDVISPDEPVSVKGFSWNSPVIHSDTHQRSSWDGSTDPASVSSRRGKSNAYDESDPYGVSPYSAGTPTRYNGDWSTSSSSAHYPRTPNDSTINNWRAGYRTDEAQRQATEYDYRRTRSADDAHYNNRSSSYYSQTQQAPPPLPNDQHVQPADYKRFADVVGVGEGQTNNSNNYMQNWKSMNSPRHHPDAMYDTSPYQSPDRMSHMTHPGYVHQWTSPNATSHTSPQSGMGYYNNSSYHSEGNSYTSQYNMSTNLGGNSPQAGDAIPRPPNVKRDTSHKLQTGDVEPTTKRLNRQTSSGRRNTSISSIEEISEKDLNNLNVSMKRSVIASPSNEVSPSKPQSLKQEDRLSTIDKFLVGVEVPDNSPSRSNRPRPLDHGDRMTTMDQINMLVKDIDGEIPLNDGLHEFSETEAVGVISKPSPMGDNDRINTLGTMDSTDLFGGISHTAPV